jgi:tetratricopeptide (TPR) repeat protein
MFKRAACLLCLWLVSVPVLCQAPGFPGAGSKADWLKANGCFAEGNQLMETRKYAEAIGKYRAAIAIYDLDWHYYYNLGLASKKSGAYKAAVEAFGKSLSLSQSNWKAWKGLANSLYKLGRYAEAREAFVGALACQPPPAEVADIKKALAAIAHFEKDK